MIIDNKFELKEIVYLKTDSQQKERIITGFIVRSTSIIYELSCADESCSSYDFEISKERDVVKATSN